MPYCPENMKSGTSYRLSHTSHSTQPSPMHNYDCDRGCILLPYKRPFAYITSYFYKDPTLPILMDSIVHFFIRKRFCHDPVLCVFQIRPNHSQRQNLSVGIISPVPHLEYSSDPSFCDDLYNREFLGGKSANPPSVTL